jgi:hypothetical protein
MEPVTNFVRDPNSNQFSASRLLLCSTLIIGVPAILVLVIKGMFPPKDAVNLVLGVVASLSGIYAINSGAGAFGRNRGNTIKEEIREEKKEDVMQDVKDAVEKIADKVGEK